MLTRELAIARYEDGRVLPDRLSRRGHSPYIALAEGAIQVYREGIGRMRRELHRAVHAVFAAQSDCPIRRIDAFCKLLDDKATFAKGNRGTAAGLRQSVFRRAAAMHPLVREADRLSPHDEAAAKTIIAAELGMPWEQLDGQLFADIMECQKLEAFAGYPSGEALLARYNVAQVQVCLFRATQMTIWAQADFKTIVRYAKLARLMHDIRRQHDAGYVIRLDGPASAMRSTRRYGVALAKFLPALIACRDWRMHAVLQTRRTGWFASLDLSHEDRLHSHLPPPEEFDSRVEELFAQRWGCQREGWTLHREAEILHQGQKVFLPDFVLKHENGLIVLLEIVGFWTPEYLQAKAQTLRAFQDRRILLAIAGPASRQMTDLPPGTIRYKTVLRPEQVLERLRTITN